MRMERMERRCRLTRVDRGGGGRGGGGHLDGGHIWTEATAAVHRANSPDSLLLLSYV